jgi:hypothetical protein
MFFENCKLIVKNIAQTLSQACLIPILCRIISTVLIRTIACVTVWTAAGAHTAAAIFWRSHYVFLQYCSASAYLIYLKRGMFTSLNFYWCPWCISDAVKSRNIVLCELPKGLIYGLMQQTAASNQNLGF